MFLQIDHKTEYRYAENVGLTPHLLRLIPRSSQGLLLLQSSVKVHPEASVRWNLDVQGNIVGFATFPSMIDHLVISSSLRIEQKLTNPFDFLIDDRAMYLPISYDERESSQLYHFLNPREVASNRSLEDMLRPFLQSGSEGSSTLDVLIRFCRAIPGLFRYTARHEPGVRTVAETLKHGDGTCRDFAHLFMEAARSLGIAARYVSGYLCSSPGTPGESHTHGWSELYLPGAGWRGFDPTNGILAGAHHVAVATSVAAGEIPPVEGSYCGKLGLCIAHDVTISARELLPGEVV